MREREIVFNSKKDTFSRRTLTNTRLVLLLGIFLLALPIVTVPVNHSFYQDGSKSFSNASQASPIIIQGDNDLTSLGLLGDGSQESPFLLDGLTITSNSDEPCISVNDITLHLIISNCVLTGYEIPTHPYSVIHINNVSSSVIVQDCIVNTYGFYGVLIQRSTSVTVEDCTINPLDDVEIGISVHNSTDITLSRCDVGTQYIYISDDFLDYFGITSNVTVYDCQSGGITIGSFVTGQCEIYDCTITGEGIVISGPFPYVPEECVYTTPTIHDNVIDGSSRGIHFLGNGMEFYSNTVKNCENIAMTIEGNHSLIHNNTIQDNRRGIQLTGLSYDNHIYYNNFINNVEYNAMDSGTNNQFDDGVSAGNYWDDIGEAETYTIDGPAGSIDRWPLSSPISGNGQTPYDMNTTLVITGVAIASIVVVGVIIRTRRP